MDLLHEHRPGGTEAPGAVPEIRRPKGIGQWVAAAVVLAALALLAHAIVTAPNLRWDVISHYLFENEVLQGVAGTMKIASVAVLVSIVVGLPLAMCALSRNVVLSTFAFCYVWAFRSVPLLVQIIIWYNLGALFPQLSVAVPFGGPHWLQTDTNSLISPFAAAILGLGLNYAAYMSEVIRGGMLSVPAGQTMAARALGVTKHVITFRIVLPQALRAIIPASTNTVVMTVKDTSLVTVIGSVNILFSVQVIYARNYLTIPLLIVATLWYFAIVSALTILQRLLERRFSRSVRHA